MAPQARLDPPVWTLLAPQALLDPPVWTLLRRRLVSILRFGRFCAAGSSRPSISDAVAPQAHLDSISDDARRLGRPVRIFRLFDIAKLVHEGDAGGACPCLGTVKARPHTYGGCVLSAAGLTRILEHRRLQLGRISCDSRFSTPRRDGQR